MIIDPPETVFPLPWYFVLAVILFGCVGCASNEEVWQRICYEQPIGQSEQGMLVVRHFCVKEGG